jgi:hypothetical protein
MSVTRAKEYQLIRASGSRLKPGDTLEVGGRTVKVNRQGTVRVKDAAFGAALVEKYGPKSRNPGTFNQLVGAELETYNQERHADKVRRTHYFTMPALPWHQYDELGRRIK